MSELLQSDTVSKADRSQNINMSVDEIKKTIAEIHDALKKANAGLDLLIAARLGKEVSHE